MSLYFSQTHENNKLLNQSMEYWMWFTLFDLKKKTAPFGMKVRKDGSTSLGKTNYEWLKVKNYKYVKI